MNPVKLFALAMVVVFSSALAAQQDISVEYPIGTSRISGATVNFGDDDSGVAILLTIRILNVGTTNLTLDTSTSNRPCNCTNAERLDWFVTQPATTVLTPTSSVDFTLEIDPNEKGDWSVLLRIFSDDPNENPFTLRFKGSNGEAEEEDDDCSTGEGSGPSLLLLLGALSAGVVAMRLRASRG
jgi:hypothetical protein